MKKLTKLIAVVSACCLSFGITACDSAPAAKTYEQADFVLSGFWQPHDITEQGFTLYKNAGLNNILMGYHDGEWTSENRAYLGSVLTKKNLELCGKVGLTATLNFSEWYRSAVEGSDYGDTPFTSYDLYGEYKDIITSIHMCDEPSIKQIDYYADDNLIADFKKVYNVPYFINLFPSYADLQAIGVEAYDEYLDYFDKNILSKFEENKMVSVDYYPFRATRFEAGWLACLNKVANLAKKHSARTHFYIQTANKNEFKSDLTEADIRLQVYVSLAFGATDLSYYCYSDPYSPDEPLYEYCILNPDGTPSPLYEYVKNVNSEISAFSSAILAYDWVKCMGISDGDIFSASSAGINNLRVEADFSDRKYVSDITTSGNCLIGVFERTQDEGYMIINYGNPEETKTCDYSVKLKGEARYIAVYGGEGFDGKPLIMRANSDNICKLTIKPGEGKFIVPIA